MLALHALHDHTTQCECISDSSCTHDMDKFDSLFSSLGEVANRKKIVENDYTLTGSGCGNIECQNGVIINVYHVHPP